MNRFLIGLLLCGATSAFAAAPQGGIDAQMLQRLRATYQNTPSDKAISNALKSTDIDILATNADNKNNFDDNFSHRVKSKGITNQKSSGRCWLFTGLNTLRSQMMEEHNLPKLELSQNYNFFFDQLEKSNLFLQEVLNTADLPMEDTKVTFLFKNPVSDGGQFTGISDNLLKYGVVPKEVMVETFSSSATSKLRRNLQRKLREQGLQLRRMKESGASAGDIAKAKEQMLSEVYRMLALTLGVPPTEFTWTRKDKDGKVVSTKTYTPQSFYKEFAGNDLKSDYVMFMNAPTREYYKLYEIDLDRHMYDGKNWCYINVPMEDIKEMAIASIKDGKMMYFSCDVGKFLNRENGTLDVNNFDYDSLFGVKFGMDKADRIRTFDSGSSHAMTLVGVDLDEAGKPKKWLIENSWGNGANDGHLIMTDNWFDEYMFRLVVNKKFVPAKLLAIEKQKPILLPPTDPMFLDEE